jgi:N-acetylmuramoyl-L-alanine amidase
VGPTGLEEKAVNLEIALKLKNILETNGADVILTRYGMEGVGIYERPEKAKDNNCHILISIHNNALPDGVNPFLNNGVSTYYYHAQSLELARAIQKELVKKLQIPDQGFYYANFALTRPYQFLSVLVECAFIIYPEQEELLRGEVFQKKCALSIYQGILNYVKGD